jgi:hypothetical protein
VADWQVDDRLYLIGVFAVLFPGEAAKNWTGGEKDWLYTMLSVAYSF